MIGEGEIMARSLKFKKHSANFKVLKNIVGADSTFPVATLSFARSTERGLDYDISGYIIQYSVLARTKYNDRDEVFSSYSLRVVRILCDLGWIHRDAIRCDDGRIGKGAQLEQRQVDEYLHWMLWMLFTLFYGAISFVRK